MLAHSAESVWRNRSEYLTGRLAIVALLTRKWKQERDYRLIKEPGVFHEGRVAVRFAYECRDTSGHWRGDCGNEHWESGEARPIVCGHTSINELLIRESGRLLHWPLDAIPSITRARENGSLEMASMARRQKARCRCQGSRPSTWVRKN